jgi:CRP-like cAMP-binding protein
MEESPISEILPGLYRAVLDSVAELEAHGLRRDAAAIRADATHAYSRAWTAAAAHRLRTLHARAERIRDSRRNRRYEAVLESLGRRPDIGRQPDLERTTA